VTPQMNPAGNDDNSRHQGDLERFLGVLRRRFLLILLCIVVAVAAATGISLVQTKEYSATASLLFRNPGFAQDLFGSNTTQPATDPTREAATNQALVGLEVVAERTAKSLGEGTRESIDEMVTVSSDGQSEIVSVTATDPDPKRAKRIANTFARQFISFRTEADKSRLLQAKQLAEKGFRNLTTKEQNGVRGKSLSSAAERLGVLASLQTGDAELVQPADLPTSPSSPKPIRNGLIGAILGLLLGVGLSVLFERMNRRLRSPEEAREAFGLPILGTIPESDAIVASNQDDDIGTLPFMENEAFRTLRASLLYFNVDRDMRTLAVTSQEAGVGKSTVAWNLALVAATSSRVAIVETDLRRPTMARQHELKVGPGLAEVLTHQATLEDAIQSHPLPNSTNGSGVASRTLDVVTCGALPPNPAELLESQAMAESLAWLSERYDLVVIDTAPIAVVSDAFPILQKVQGVIVVARMEKTTSDAARQVREQLDRLGSPVLGVVANAVKIRRRDRYGYGYYGAGAEDDPDRKVGASPRR
jgi:succinoglycan biosynthesis transport protein ExoP